MSPRATSQGSDILVWYGVSGCQLPHPEGMMGIRTLRGREARRAWNQDKEIDDDVCDPCQDDADQLRKPEHASYMWPVRHEEG